MVERLKAWVKKDMENGKHNYTEYIDIDGVRLAERMVLREAFYGDDERLFYVKKDVKKDKYYLQSFADQVTYFGEYLDNKYSQVKSRGIGILRAKDEFEVLFKLEGELKILFLEDYGYEAGKYPPRVNIINGEVVLEKLKE